jgi:rod shape-determining protein MreD
MALRRALLIATLILVAVVVQVTVLAPLPFPGATPDLVLVVVAAVAFSFGAVPGAVTGFAAGLVIDLAPPAEGTVGMSSLILTLVGYALGRVFEAPDRPVIVTTLLTAAAAAAGVLLAAVVGGLLGDPRILWEQVPSFMATTAVYAAVLALPVVPLVRAMSRRIVPEAFPR